MGDAADYSVESNIWRQPKIKGAYMVNQKPQPIKGNQISQSPQSVIKELEAMGFSNANAEENRRLIMSASGLDGTGKTHLILTAPEPIFFFNIDIGTEGVIEKFRASGRDIYVYNIRVPKGAKKDVYEDMWHDVWDRVTKVYKVNEGTMGADTGTEMYELARLAHFGKLTQVMPHNYVEVKAQWRELLRMAYDSRMNTIFVNKVKPVYVNDKRTKDYEIAGFDEMKYMVQVAVTTFREKTEEGGVRFGFTVDKCRKKPSLTGNEYRTVLPITDADDLQLDPVVNFNFLLEQVYGG